VDVWKLYEKKIKMVEEYNIKLRDTYCSKINKALKAYKECNATHLNEMKKVVDTATKYLQYAQQPSFRGVVIDDAVQKRMFHTIHKEAQREKKRLDFMNDCNMTVLNYKFSIPYTPPLNLTEIDAKIQEHEENLHDTSVKQKIRLIYAQNLRNIDHSMAEKLSVECQHWLEYLKL
jgi:hypothetical protein